MTQLGEGTQIGTIQDDEEDFHWLEVNYCYPDGLPVEGTYLATDSDGLQHRGSLNDLGGLCLNRLPAGAVDVEFIPPEDSDTLDTLRKSIKDVLDEILAEKRAETEQTEARLARMSTLEQGGSLLASAGRGFWNGAIGLIEFAGDTLVTVANIAVYLSPIERLNNLLEASYKSYQSGDLTEGKWRQSLLDNMKQEELEDLSRLLGFDPRKIDLTLITDAYEITALIARDDATLAILKNFAKDYVGAQSSLDWAEFAGGGVFDIVLAALLIAFTGGAGLIAQAGSKIRHISRLRKLGGLLPRLGKVLKRRQLNKKIKVDVDNKTKVEAERLEGPKLTSRESGEKLDAVPDSQQVSSGTNVTDGTTNVFHATTNPQAAQGVLSGVDPKFLNPNNRFGAAFYVAERPGTTLKELAHHGASSTHGIRFDFNTSKAKTLDLTSPDVAKAWNYNGGPISSATQQIGAKARDQGFNVIRFKSERDLGGVNNAILDNFDDLLIPQFVSPTKP